MPREEYLLDSAHHGLAMNAAGTKLCVAGTMSDYAAIVARDDVRLQDLPTSARSRTGRPTAPDGKTAGSRSAATTSVVVLDYATERELARVPVGDHPQRVRLGAVNRASLPGLPPPPGSRDRRAPHIGVLNKPRRCQRRSFRIRVRIIEQSALRFADVRRGFRRLRRTRRKNFSVRVPVRGLRPGTHRLRVPRDRRGGQPGGADRAVPALRLVVRIPGK